MMPLSTYKSSIHGDQDQTRITTEDCSTTDDMVRTTIVEMISSTRDTSILDRAAKPRQAEQLNDEYRFRASQGMLVETDLDLKLTGCSGAGSSRKDGVSQLQQRQGTGKLDRLSTRKNS
ncbi:hypothetical protein KCU79_g67, partial [Aureobasidium melanogenum]